MKKIIILLIFSFVVCSYTFAQSALAELDKVREIKLLKSTRVDVRRILADYNLDISDDSRYYQWFSTNNAHVKISYSKGKCSDNSAYWNVDEWKVTKIDVSPEKPIKIQGIGIGIQDIGIDYSNFRKERLYANESFSYVYYDKDLGIALEVIKNEIRKFHFFPSKKDYSLLCNNQSARKFYSSERWFIDSRLKDRIIDYDYYADVVNIVLSQPEINADCAQLNSPQKTNSKKILVSTTANDPENDALTYYYTVSGGKIVGQGANVVWDLTGVKPGTYSITAGVDNGCGICGHTKTKEVVVKECPNQ
jgi:hypothetical protein